eukprot:470-Eustigmatos_ZCMA.PRE.1
MCSVAPETRRANSPACAGGIHRSRWPHRMSVGTRIAASPLVSTSSNRNFGTILPMAWRAPSA